MIINIKPLKINKILVSQPKPASERSPYFDITTKFGVQVDFRPFIKVEPITVREFRTQKIDILDYTAVVFSAKKGIEHFFRICDEMHITIPETMKYFCLSQQIALYLQRFIQYRKRKVFFSETGQLAGLLDSFNRHIDEKYLLVMPEQYSKEIPNALTNLNANYSVAMMYRTVSNDFGKNEKLDHDMLVFFSPIGVASLLKNFPDFKQGDIRIACAGETTANAVKEAGLRLDLCVTPNSPIPSMPAALLDYVEKQSRRK